MRDHGVYVISVAAELAGVHPQTLRIYERKGLLDPARTSGGSRRYSDADLDRLRRISALTGAGVNLEGVRRILELEDQTDRLRSELRAARAEAERQVKVAEAHDRRDLVPVRSGALVPLRPARSAGGPGPPSGATVITQRRS